MPCRRMSLADRIKEDLAFALCNFKIDSCVDFLNVTRTQCSTHVKKVCQHSGESRGFSPGTPVSSHREVDRVG